MSSKKHYNIGTIDLLAQLKKIEIASPTNIHIIGQKFQLSHSYAQVAAYLANGYTIKECAEVLKLKESSVRTYVKKILSSLQCHTQGALVQVVLILLYEIKISEIQAMLNIPEYNAELPQTPDKPQNKTLAPVANHPMPPVLVIRRHRVDVSAR